MTVNAPDLFGVLSQRAGWLQARHAVLTENVANADTPGYKPRDLVEPDFDSMVAKAGSGRLVMETRHPAHQAAERPAPAGVEARDVDGFEVAPSGNAVVIEEQAQKLAETSLDYQLATDLYGKFVGMMRTAIGSGGA